MIWRRDRGSRSERGTPLELGVAQLKFTLTALIPCIPLPPTSTPRVRILHSCVAPADSLYISIPLSFYRLLSPPLSLASALSLTSVPTPLWVSDSARSFNSLAPDIANFG